MVFNYNLQEREEFLGEICLHKTGKQENKTDATF